jgi:hypothetical protein
MLDLYNNKYDRETLKKHIYEVKLIDVLKTQMLDMEFIVRYILSDLYQFHIDDMNISVEDVIKYQPHIEKRELEDALINYNSDEDSVEDFEAVSNKVSK